MLKKLLSATALVTLSLTASATEFIQYNLTGGGVSGYFFENAEDKSIAGYRIDFDYGNRHVFFGASGPYDYISNQSSNFWGVAGPTNFRVYDNLTEVYVSYMTFNFTLGTTPGTYAFDAYLSQVVVPDYPIFGTPPTPLSLSVSGTAVGIPVTTGIDPYDDGIAHVIPVQNVPEPTSLSLLGIGALAVASTVLRAKS